MVRLDFSEIRYVTPILYHLGRVRINQLFRVKPVKFRSQTDSRFLADAGLQLPYPANPQQKSGFYVRTRQPMSE